LVNFAGNCKRADQRASLVRMINQSTVLRKRSTELFRNVTRTRYCGILQLLIAGYTYMYTNTRTCTQRSVKRGSIHAVDLRNCRYNEQRAADFLHGDNYLLIRANGRWIAGRGARCRGGQEGDFSEASRASRAERNRMLPRLPYAPPFLSFSRFRVGAG